MRYLLVLLLFLPVYSFGWAVIHYDHYSKKNLNNETEIVAIKAENGTGKLLVMSSVTREFFYEVDLFCQPDDIYLLDNPDFIIHRDFRWGKNSVDFIVRLYHKGVLTDSIIDTRKMKAFFNGDDNSQLYYSDSLETFRLSFEKGQFTIDSFTHKFVQVTPLSLSFENLYTLNKFSEHLDSDDALTIDGIPFETWVTNHTTFENEIHLKIGIAVIGGKKKCTVRILYSKDKIPDSQLDEISRMIENAVIADSFYLDRIHSWYFEKSVVLNHATE